MFRKPLRNSKNVQRLVFLNMPINEFLKKLNSQKNLSIKKNWHPLRICQKPQEK